MPRYRKDDEYDQDTRGVHRRRLQRRGSSTPIIIGAVIGVIALIVILVVAMGSKEDPEAEKTAIRLAGERFLQAALSKDRASVFGVIRPTGPRGWITRRLGVELGKKYRFPDDQQNPGEARKWKAEQDERMYKEIIGLPRDLGIKDVGMIKDVANRGSISMKMSEAELRLRNAGGQVLITLVDEGGGSWSVQYWEVENSAWGS